MPDAPLNQVQSQRALRAISVACVMAFINVYLTQAILPELSKEFLVQPTMAALTVSVMTAMLALSSLVVGPLSDRVGFRPVMVWASGLLMLPTLLCAFAPSFAWLLLGRALQGACIPGVTSVALAAAPKILPSRIGAALGVVVASNVLGGLISRLGAGLLTDFMGWRAAFLVSSLAAGVGAWVLAQGLPTGLGALRESLGLQQPGRGRFGLLGLLRNRPLLGAYLVGGAMFFAFIGMFSFLSYRLVGEPFFLSSSLVGLAFVSYLAGVWASPRAGKLSDRFGRRRVIACGLGMLAVGLLLTLSNWLPLLVLGLVVACLGNFSVQPAVTALVGDLAPGHARGAAAALYQLFYYLGGSLGGVVVGLAWQTWAWSGVVLGCLLAVVLAGLSNLLLCQPIKRASDP